MSIVNSTSGTNTADLQRLNQHDGDNPVRPTQAQTEHFRSALDNMLKNRLTPGNHIDTARVEHVNNNEGSAHRASGFLKKILGALAIAAGVALLGAFAAASFGVGPAVLGAAAAAVTGALGTAGGIAAVVTAGTASIVGGLAATGVFSGPADLASLENYHAISDQKLNEFNEFQQNLGQNL